MIDFDYQATALADVVRRVRPRSPYMTVRAICRMEISDLEGGGFVQEPADALVNEVARLVDEQPDITPAELALSGNR